MRDWTTRQHSARAKALPSADVGLQRPATAVQRANYRMQLPIPATLDRGAPAWAISGPGGGEALGQ